MKDKMLKKFAIKVLIFISCLAPLNILAQSSNDSTLVNEAYDSQVFINQLTDLLEETGAGEVKEAKVRSQYYLNEYEITFANGAQLKLVADAFTDVDGKIAVEVYLLDEQLDDADQALAIFRIFNENLEEAKFREFWADIDQQRKKWEEPTLLKPKDGIRSYRDISDQSYTLRVGGDQEEISSQDGLLPGELLRLPARSEAESQLAYVDYRLIDYEMVDISQIEAPNIYLDEQSPETIWVNSQIINAMLNRISQDFEFDLSPDHLTVKDKTVYYYPEELVKAGYVNEIYFYASETPVPFVEVRLTTSVNRDEQEFLFNYFAHLLQPEIEADILEKHYQNWVDQVQDDVTADKDIHVVVDGFTPQTISMRREFSEGEAYEYLESVPDEYLNAVQISGESWHTASKPVQAELKNIYAELNHPLPEDISELDNGREIQQYYNWLPEHGESKRLQGTVYEIHDNGFIVYDNHGGEHLVISNLLSDKEAGETLAVKVEGRVVDWRDITNPAYLSYVARSTDISYVILPTKITLGEELIYDRGGW